MGDGLPSGVGYGDFGHFLYAHGDDQPTFQRSVSQSLALRPLGKDVSVQEGTKTFDEGQAATTRATIRTKQIKPLVQAFPELQPAGHLLPELLQESEAVLRSAKRRQRASSNFLAVGELPDPATQRTTQFLAFPCGPAGSDVRIVQIQIQRQGWDDDRNAWICVPIVYGEAATWQGPGAPIEWLKSCSSSRGATWLVVGLQSRSVILRPVLRRAAYGTASRLMLECVSELWVEDTGGAFHVDVTFDPWRSGFFALVDQRCRWSVRKFSQRKSGESSRMYDGVLGEDLSDNENIHANNAWAKVTWLLDSTILAICNRSLLQLIDISDQDALVAAAIDIQSTGAKRGKQDAKLQILDLALLKTRPGSWCMLTNTHVLVKSVKRMPGGDLHVEHLAQFNHYRDERDLSLRMRLLENEADDLTILLFSSTQPIFTTHSLRFTEEVVVVHEPSSTYGFQQDTFSGGYDDVLDLNLLSIAYGGKVEDKEGQNIASRLHDCRVRLFSIVILDWSLSVFQRTCYTSSPSSERTVTGPPTWAANLSKSATRVADEDFIDDDDLDEEARGVHMYAEPFSSYQVRRRAAARFIPDDAWTVTFENTVRELNSVDTAEVVDLDVVLDDAHDLLPAVRAGATGSWQTLRETVQGEVAISSCTRADERIADLMKRTHLPASGEPTEIDEVDVPEAQPRTLLQPVWLPRSLRTPAVEPSFAAYLDSIRKDWQLDLPSELPEIVTSARSQMAQRMAAELTLAGYVMRPEPIKDELPSQSQQPFGQSQSESQDLSLRLSRLFGRYASSRSQTPALPTPSASGSVSGGPRSTITASSYSSTIFNEATNRLSRYTTFSHPNPRRLMPRRPRRILAQWTPGTDPLAFDWRAASHAIAEDSDEEGNGEPLTEKERANLQRRAERELRRQRREAEESRRQQLLSSQAPQIAIASSSQPQPRHGASRSASQAVGGTDGVGSSQIAGFSQSQMPASQVLPGRHGGRPPRKKRKPGF